LETLAPGVELASPISRSFVFRGQDDIRVLLTAVYGMLKELRWTGEVGDDRTRVILGETKIGPPAPVAGAHALRPPPRA
jgi:hypothetical protein